MGQRQEHVCSEQTEKWDQEESLSAEEESLSARMKTEKTSAPETTIVAEHAQGECGRTCNFLGQLPLHGADIIPLHENLSSEPGRMKQQ